MYVLRKYHYRFIRNFSYFSDYFCHECCSMFENQEKLKEHQRELKHGTKRKRKLQKAYLCGYNGCNKRFDGLKALNRHKKTHCRTRYKSKQGLKTHHDGMRSFGICKICSKKFSDSSALRKHIKYIHFEGVRKRSFVCRICKQTFERKYCLQNHWKVHEKNRKIYQCELCKSKFNTKFNWQKHQRIYH